MRKVVVVRNATVASTEVAVPVVVKQRSYDVYFCPHCEEEIHEKGTWYDIDKKLSYHRDCGKPIEYPKQDYGPEANELLKGIATAYSNEKATRVYEISAKDYQLNLLEEFFSMVQYCGAVGASRGIQLFIDGDGSAQIKFKRTDSKDKLQEYPEDIDTDADPVKMRGID